MFDTVAISFIVFLGLFLGVGILSARRKKETTEDYLVASRDVHPWMMALSAVSTSNSGFMFIALIGSTFTEGLSAMWVMIGWVVGDYVAWIVRVPERLRRESERRGSCTIPSFLGDGLSHGRWVTMVGGLVTLAFLGIYAAAQLQAGSKALTTLFDWPMNTGAIIGACVVLVYCVAGGIRASIWTDTVQSIVMFGSMLLLVITCVAAAGGLDAMWQTLASIDPQLVAVFPPTPEFGLFFFVLGWLFAGFGVVGQPHIMIRSMTIDNPDHMDRARRVYVLWNVLFATAAVLLGLAARAFLPEADSVGLQNVQALLGLCGDPASLSFTDPQGACALAQSLFNDAAQATPSTVEGLNHVYLQLVNGQWALFDAELAMPLVAQDLLSPVLVGLCLAGLFAATMSTADSQVLACSAALTQDIFPGARQRYGLVKLATLLVTLFALGVAIYPQEPGASGGVFTLVVLAWAALASGLGPLLVLRAFKREMPGVVAMGMILAGVGGVLGWRYGLGYTGAIYDVLPGMVCGFLVYGLWTVSAGRAWRAAQPHTN